MNGDKDPNADVKQHRLTPETLAFINAAHRPAFEPHKIRHKKQKFVHGSGPVARTSRRRFWKNLPAGTAIVMAQLALQRR